MTIKNYIWIRHAEKKYCNGKGNKGNKQHDPSIIKDATQIFSLVEQLALSYGLPDRIVCSPFLRTRQTANIIKNIVETKYHKKMSIIIDVDIREYLGFCKNVIGYADLDFETERLLGGKIKTQETLENLEKRISTHLNHINNYNENIWIITHGIVMSYIYKSLDKEVPERPQPLDYIILRNNQLFKNF